MKGHLSDHHSGSSLQQFKRGGPWGPPPFHLLESCRGAPPYVLSDRPVLLDRASATYSRRGEPSWARTWLRPDLPDTTSIRCNPQETAIGRHVQVCRFHVGQSCAKQTPARASIGRPVNADPCGSIDGITGGVTRVCDNSIDRHIRQSILS